MIRTLRAAGFVLVFATVTLVGCSGSAASPTAPSGGSGSLALTAEQLSGTWTLTSVQGAGEAVQATPAGATYTITFQDGRLSTRADCNTCSGAFALQETTLTVGSALACTRAACPTMAFETRYTTLLSGEHTVSVASRTLVLSSARGILVFTR
jgi:heat shock protein HslJ